MLLKILPSFMKNFNRMFLFYTTLTDANTLTLTDDEHLHCTKVLRKQVGDELFVTDGLGSIFTVRISNITKDKTITEIIDKKTEISPESKLAIAISPTKNAARIEWFVEKAVEVGIQEIIIFQAKRTEKKSFNQKRIEKIIISAMKQSLNTHLPVLKYAHSLKEVIAFGQSYDQKFIAYCDGPTEVLVNKYIPAASSIVLIGPEGDFTNDEIADAINANYTPISLGKSRLRTETAGLAALMMMKYK